LEAGVTAIDAAEIYMDRGLLPIPIPHGEKAPKLHDWPALRLSKADLPQYFNGAPANLGLILGDQYGTTDVDLDYAEAVAIAGELLPETAMVFGRASKPASHFFYRCDPPIRSKRYVDPIDKACIAELRCQKTDGTIGFQTVVPPSTHPSGEQIRFEQGRNGHPANVDAPVLQVAVARVAAAALLARHWPGEKAGRNQAFIALAGALARGGWTVEQAITVHRALYLILWGANANLGACRAEVVATFEKHASGFQTTGKHTLEDFVDKRVVGTALAWLGITSAEDFATHLQDHPHDRQEAQLSNNVASWPAPMADEAFYGLAGRFVRLVEPHTEADRNFLLLMFLVYAGNVVGRKCHIMAGGDAHYTNLYLCGVGPTSVGRKGSATSPSEKFFTYGERAPGIGNLLPSLSSGEGLIWTIRDAVWGRQFNPKTKEMEKVLLQDGVNDKRLIVNMGEFMGALQVMRRQGNTLSPVVRSAWESGNLVSPTKNSPAKATNAHVSIIGAISKEELFRAIEQVDADNGLLNRFLWCCSRRSKPLPEGGRLWEVMESPEWLTLQDDFKRIAPAAPRRLVRDGDAGDLWGRDSHPDRGVYAELSRERFGLAGAATARAHAQVLRLSLLYAVLDGASDIQRQHLDAALAVWDYCEASARYIFGDALGDPTADAILKALRTAANGLTRTEIRDHFHRKKQEKEIARALLVLHEKGLARFEREETAGRPVERWFATTGMAPTKA
jgi:hypothetical protein